LIIEFKGVVTRSTGSWYSIRTDTGELVECRLRGKFRLEGMKTTNPIAVGDIVHCHYSPTDQTANIVHIEERRNCIVRKSTKMSKQRHIIAANVDLSLLIATVAFPRTSLGFIDRFLVSAEAYNVPSVIVFNKIDLHNDQLELIFQHYKQIYEAAGYIVTGVSALYGTHVDQLRNLLKGNVTLFSGHSGVGKSHIINALDPGLQLKTGKISEYHQKGKHTTTFAEMHYLNDGVTIIDTPGIKEFGIVDFEAWELGHWFPEFRNILPFCKFSNCTHVSEPGCAVRSAAEEEKIHPERYVSYLSILNNVEEEPDHWE
jgi:ribosome biogenesis GTPase / thiamine phosphate phosphatase